MFGKPSVNVPGDGTRGRGPRAVRRDRIVCTYVIRAIISRTSPPLPYRAAYTCRGFDGFGKRGDLFWKNEKRRRANVVAATRTVREKFARPSVLCVFPRSRRPTTGLVLVRCSRVVISVGDGKNFARLTLTPAARPAFVYLPDSRIVRARVLSLPTRRFLRLIVGRPPTDVTRSHAAAV